MDFWLTY